MLVNQFEPISTRNTNILKDGRRVGQCILFSEPKFRITRVLTYIYKIKMERNRFKEYSILSLGSQCLRRHTKECLVAKIKIQGQSYLSLRYWTQVSFLNKNEKKTLDIHRKRHYSPSDLECNELNDGSRNLMYPEIVQNAIRTGNHLQQRHAYFFMITTQCDGQPISIFNKILSKIPRLKSILARNS